MCRPGRVCLSRETKGLTEHAVCELGLEGSKTASQTNGFAMMWWSWEAQVGGKEG